MANRYKFVASLMLIACWVGETKIPAKKKISLHIVDDVGAAAAELLK